MERAYVATADLSPPEGVVVLTKIDDADGVRNEGKLMKRGNLWWTSDGAMYVYYRPTHWMPLPSPPSNG